MNHPALLGALALLVVLAGCTGILADDPPRDEQAVASIDETRDALDAVETYRYETDLRVTATADGRTERVDARVEGAVNATARRMNSTSESESQTRHAVLVNRTAHRECPRPWSFWAVENQSAEDWDALTPAYRQLSLLDSGALRHEGTATVGGRNATLVVGEPPASALRRYNEGGSQPLFGGPEISDATLEVWIDDETGLPLRTRLRFTVSSREGSATARMDTRFDGYGEPVTVEVPEEALADPLEHGCPGE